jgi:hypothetical protein
MHVDSHAPETLPEATEGSVAAACEGSDIYFWKR